MSTPHPASRPLRELNPTTPAAVSVDPETMGGIPCFAGTRVPVSMVLRRVDSGEDWAQLVSDYPFLTEEHVAAARTFVADHPGTDAVTQTGRAGDGLVIVERRVLPPRRQRR
jgi:uncharacterized protein (DUF433 family)